MNYKTKRRLMSHNFINNSKIVNKLVLDSRISKNDLVLEIGPGKGSITRELIRVAGKVIAVELDEYFFNILKKEFNGLESITLINNNFFSFTTPSRSYKVFSNIPFSITSEIVKKLTADKNFQEGYLIMQKEAAQKFIGKPIDTKNSMQSVLLKPWFDISVFWKFSAWDFTPKPNVEIVMLKIVRRELPLLSYKQRNVYRDYVYVSYNRQKMAKLEYEYFFMLFNNYLKNSGPDEKKINAIKAQRIMKEQGLIRKIHRTRKDNKWRTF